MSAQDSDAQPRPVAERQAVADRPPAEPRAPHDQRRPFDWYAATLAAGITGPFATWGLYVLLAPHYILMAAGCLLFVSFVFWGFGRLRIA